VRQFRQLSMTSFLAIANPAWEIGLFVFSPALIDGGRPNLIWSLFWNFIAYGPIYLSLAEMASMVGLASDAVFRVCALAHQYFRRQSQVLNTTGSLVSR
jgi:hypothetical protein